MAECAEPTRSLELTSYVDQAKTWPKLGRHVLAHYDDNSIVVYQAFKQSIADYAVQNQRFGGPEYKFTRMSWIKTNFLWMMYRSGWAQKHNQGRVLAVRITRQGFEEILSHAYTAQLHKKEGIEKPRNCVRLQWDPDHTPKMGNCRRRAIQLGLRGDILTKYATEFIVSITDITPMVHEQYQILKTQGEEALQMPVERVYHVKEADVAARIFVDDWECPQMVVTPGAAETT